MKQLLELIRHISWVDIADILIVAAIIYRFLITIRGTRAVPMLIGLISLAILFWASYNYEMYALHWILTNFFEYFFILIVILFQDQIRMALVSLSGTNIFKRKDLSEFEKMIDEVLIACAAMKNEKTGALIVIEKNNGLLNYSQTGTIIGARINSDLLYSIFQKKSPLHDGAVIIARGKIQSAGCVLPLSHHIEIERHYGTRHRAALGVTEATDALAIVVSEERREIKVACAGKFYYAQSDEKLREIIIEQFYEKSTFAPTQAEI